MQLKNNSLDGDHDTLCWNSYQACMMHVPAACYSVHKVSPESVTIINFVITNILLNQHDTLQKETMLHTLHLQLRQTTLYTGLQMFNHVERALSQDFARHSVTFLVMLAVYFLFTQEDT